ncbi:hypothetical protein EZS27_014270 [termite gut metagenome]|uniref:Uncharacterized protein n=1 Tax=termite gut metagenome TaxID=433724 RepID=A0A5J4RV02_9ZZZZ
MINENLSGNALKTKIRSAEKEVTAEFTEIIEPNVTSKDSMYRKSLFTYPTVIKDFTKVPKRVIVEINAFANPYPYVKQEISSFIADFLTATNR